MGSARLAPSTTIVNVSAGSSLTLTISDPSGVQVSTTTTGGSQSRVTS